MAWQLPRAGKALHSIALEADARRLLSDVWTSAGVLVGVATAAFTGWDRIDPVVALAVAANIVWTGVSLVRRPMVGLLDTSLPGVELAAIRAVLDRYQEEADIETHALRTRQAGARRFTSVHVLVPGDWTVNQGHRLLEAIERDIRDALPGTTVFTHLEPLDDPTSWDDTLLDRPADSASHW